MGRGPDGIVKRSFWIKWRKCLRILRWNFVIIRKSFYYVNASELCKPEFCAKFRRNSHSLYHSERLGVHFCWNQKSSEAKNLHSKSSQNFNNSNFETRSVNSRIFIYYLYEWLIRTLKEVLLVRRLKE